MTDLLVIRSSFSDPCLQAFGAYSPAADDGNGERTPRREDTKPKENRPSDPVSGTMKAILSCSPANPKQRRKRKMKIRASLTWRWGTKVQHALPGEEEIQASKCHSKPVGKQADRDMVAASPRMRSSKRWQHHKDVHNAEEAEEGYGEEDSTLLGDKSNEQPAAPTVSASPRMSPRMRRSRRWQKRKDVHSGNNSNTQEAEEEDSTLFGDKADDDEPGNKIDNFLDQPSPPVDLSEETGGWTGEKRARVIDSPPTSEVAYYRQRVDPRDKEEFWNVYDRPEQLNEVYERLALYRIKFYKLFWEEKDVHIAQLKEEYSSATLRDEGYFECYEMNHEWYFNPEYCKRSSLDDYQRLVLRRDVEDTHISWESYLRTCATLKCDLEFLQFFEELSSELKSVEDDDFEYTKEHLDAQRGRYDTKAYDEAPKIAARFCNIHAALVHTGITDCTLSAMFDLTYRKDLDHVFLEIWKRIAKDKVDFKDALEGLYKLGLYPLQQRFIKAELEDRPLWRITMKQAYYTHVAHIDEKVPENEVLVRIKEAVDKIAPKPLIYVDYIKKKMEVAKELGVLS